MRHHFLSFFFRAVNVLHEIHSYSLSVWFDDPIMGMLNFMNFWFGSFLFGGWLIPKADMYWPFELFYYIMPYGYYLRAMSYNAIEGTTWATCPGVELSQVCVQEPDGTLTPNPPGSAILTELTKIMGVVENDDTVARDVFVLLAFGAFYKVLYIVGVLYKSSQASKIYAS
jgi:hypothetical protein